MRTAAKDQQENCCKWEVTVEAKAGYVMFGYSWIHVTAWGRNVKTDDVYRVETVGSGWFNGGVAGLGYYSLTSTSSDITAPCKWPINNGDSLSIGWGSLEAPLLGSVVNANLAIVDYVFGKLSFQDDFGVGNAPGGLSLNLPVHGGAMGAKAANVKQEGPWRK